MDLAHGQALNNKEIIAMAEKYNLSGGATKESLKGWIAGLGIKIEP